MKYIKGCWHCKLEKELAKKNASRAYCFEKQTVFYNNKIFTGITDVMESIYFNYLRKQKLNINYE